MSEQEPTVITLDNKNSIQILSQYIEVAQQKGAYLLNEAEILKRSMDVLINNVPDKEIDETTAKQLLIQGVNKGQRHGAYTLNDAALLSKVVAFVGNGLPAPAPQQAAPAPAPQQAAPASAPAPAQQVTPAPVTPVDDLSDLADPIPLKPKEV